MKCYVGGDTKPFDFDFVEACFANNRAEAKSLMWEKGLRLADECEGEWLSVRVVRSKKDDHLLDSDKSDPYVIHDAETFRLMGWRCEGDEACESCDLYSQDDKYPVCEGCGQCAECGHAKECKSK